MMPVFSSPRCANCHGRADPVSGENHGGGAVASELVGGRSANCVDCHTALGQTGDSPWALATLSKWGIKPEREVCRDMSDLVLKSMGAEGYLRHLRDDPLIGLAFEGFKGMDPSSPMWPVEEEPPPIRYDEFLRLARAWTSQGGARCGGGLNGTITFTETSTSSAPGVDFTAETNVEIKIVNGQATFRVVDKRHDNVDSPPSSSGGCPHFRHQTGSATAEGPSELQVNLRPDRYAVSASLPAVAGTMQTESLNYGGCRYGRVSRSDPYPVFSAGTIVGVEGKINPDEPNRLKGDITDTRSAQRKTMLTWDLMQED